MDRKRYAVTALILLSLGAVIGVYAGTVGVNDLFGFTTGYGFTDLNSTNVNAGTEFYRDGVNYTATIEGLIAASAGVNPFDQDLNTTDPVTFASVNATIEYYRGPLNYTTWILDKATTVPFDQNLNTTDDVLFSSVESQNWTLTRPENLGNNQTTGVYIKGQAGEALNFGDVCYLETDGDYMKADADSNTTMYVVVMAAEKLANTDIGHFLVTGYARCDSWGAWTVGSAASIMASTTGGDMTQTVPSGSGDQVQRLGYAIATKIVRFDPDSTVLEIA